MTHSALRFTQSRSFGACLYTMALVFVVFIFLTLELHATSRLSFDCIMSEPSCRLAAEKVLNSKSSREVILDVWQLNSRCQTQKKASETILYGMESKASPLKQLKSEPARLSAEVNKPFQTVMAGQTKCGCPLPTTLELDIPPKVNRTWRLLCRTTRSVTFLKDENDTAHMVYFQEDGYAWQPLTLSNGGYLAVEGLHPDTSYSFQFLAYQQGRSAMEKIAVATLSVSENLVPEPVVEAFVTGWIPGKKTLSARVRWLPGPTVSCFYDFLWYCEMDMHRKEVRNAYDLYEAVVDSLLYDKSYTLLVRTVLTDGDFYAESEAKAFTFETPRCLDMTGFTLDICTPEKLEGLKVEEMFVGEEMNTTSALYDVRVLWNAPKGQPVQVCVELKPQLMASNDTLRQVVTGNETWVLFTSVVLGESFEVRAWATSAAGSGPSVQLLRELVPEDTPHDFLSTAEKLALTVAFVCFIAVLVAVGAFYFVSFRSRLDMQKRQHKEVVTFRKNSQVSVVSGSCGSEREATLWDPRFEVPRDSIMLCDILGEGAFGVVRKAVLTRGGRNEIVAVKTLKEKPSLEAKEQLVQEVRMLQTLGRHENVVSLVACVTACLLEDIVLVSEYCAYGDLQRYLQQAHFPILPTGCILEKSHSNQYENCIESSRCGVINQFYDAMSPGGMLIGSGENFELTKEDLISFARQVAEGMEFLSDNRIIHRDLAARNVLVTAERSLKISDFGLSRDVYENNYYVKTSDGKVPIRWMAIESLLYHKYTTQSDVHLEDDVVYTDESDVYLSLGDEPLWSFGILLWEIMTFGSVPYSDASPMNLVDFLASGGRLHRPDNTSSELYAVMMSCWSLRPCDRPRFSDLKSSLDDILLTECAPPKPSVTEYLT